jgi:hypothetical protein
LERKGEKVEANGCGLNNTAPPSLQYNTIDAEKRKMENMILALKRAQMLSESKEPCKELIADPVLRFKKMLIQQIRSDLIESPPEGIPLTAEQLDQYIADKESRIEYAITETLFELITSSLVSDCVERYSLTPSE